MSGIISKWAISLFVLVAYYSNQYCSEQDEVFDFVNGLCRRCDIGQEALNGRCVCSKNAVNVDGKCTPCKEGYIPGQSKIKCVKLCSECTNCEVNGGILIMNDLNGNPLNETRCIKCTAGTILTGKNSTTANCQACNINQTLMSNTTCGCSEGFIQIGTGCFSKTYISELKPQTASIIETLSTNLQIRSSVYGLSKLSNDTENRADLLYSCLADNSRTSCFRLSQLCSIAANPSSGYCLSSKEIDFNSIGILPPMNLIPIQNLTSSRMKIFFRSFDIQGSYVSSGLLTSHTLEFSNYHKLGISYGEQVVLKESIKIKLNGEATFYEIQYKDVNGALRDIPIMNFNDRDSKPTLEDLYASGNSTLDKSFFNQITLKTQNVDFVRTLKQLFLINIVGVDNSIKIVGVAQYIDLSTDEAQQEFERKFTILFVTNIDDFWKTIKIIFIIIMVLIFLLCVFGVFLKSRENIELKAPFSFFKEFLFWFLKLFSYSMTALMISIWIFWIIKVGTPKLGQSILPSSNFFPIAFVPFMILVILVSCSLLAAIVWKLFRQTAVNIKIIDWEKPNITRGDGSHPPSSTSMWRYMMFINELNEELQKPYISFGSVFLILLGLIEGIGLGKFTQISQDFSLSEIKLNASQTTSNEHTNVFLRFFLICVANILIGIVIAIIKKIMGFFNGESFENIIDLCSVCNISLVMVNDYNRAVYIHGKNTFQTGEGSLTVIYRKLELESLGYGAGRGIVSSDDSQVFDIVDIAGLKPGEFDILEEIKNQILSAKITLKEKNFLVSCFGLKTAGIIQENEQVIKTPNLLFFKERNSFVLKYFLRTFVEEMVIFSSFIVAIFDWITGSLVAGTVIGWLAVKSLETLYGVLVLRNLTRNNKIDRRFLI
jgi:hypothetical protein